MLYEVITQIVLPARLVAYDRRLDQDNQFALRQITALGPEQPADTGSRRCAVV